MIVIIAVVTDTDKSIIPTTNQTRLEGHDLRLVEVHHQEWHGCELHQALHGGQAVDVFFEWHPLEHQLAIGHLPLQVQLGELARPHVLELRWVGRGVDDE